MSNSFENLSDEAKSVRLLDYVQDRLDADSRAEVEAAVVGNTDLADELAYYQGLANAGELAEPQADHEFGWVRLSKAIETETDISSTPPLAANDNSQLWRIATFALGLVALVQAGLLLGTSPASIEDDPIYVPVTQATGFDVQVIFENAATSEEIRELLTGIDGEIIAGPSAIGLYDVRFATEEERSIGLDTLRDATDLIESATLK
ncbi:MAG: hypothetical protein AAF292_17375 [Pseudomonadota bacterium]